MSRSGARVLLWGLLCLLAACGPGVDGKLGPQEPPGTSEPPIPRLGSVDGELADVDGRELRVRARGTGFVSSSTLLVGYKPVPTTFVSDTELTAVVQMESLTWDTDDTVHLQVRTPAPGGGMSSSRPLPYPEPELLSFTPDAFESRSPTPVRVLVTGRNFITGSVISLYGHPNALPTTVRSTGAAEVELPAGMESGYAGRYYLYCKHPEAPPRYQSNSLPVAVYDPVPEIEGVWPAPLSVNALQPQPDGGVVLPDGGAATPVELRILARGLRERAQVKWNGQPLASVQPEFGDELWVNVPREALTTAGTASLTLENPHQRGGESSPFLLPVTSRPVLRELTPQQVTMRADGGERSEVLSITAEGVGSEGIIYWDGTELGTWSDPPDEGGGKRLGLVVPASRLLSPGTHFVTVRRRSDGAMSESLPVQVVGEAPVPVARHLQPATLTAGSARQRLEVIGRGFTSRSILRLDGQARSTEFTDTERVATWLEPAELVAPGVRVVTVHTPGPGGGTSLPLLLNVVAHRRVPELLSIWPARTEAASGVPLLLNLRGSGVEPFTMVQWNGEVLSWWLHPELSGLYVSVPAHLLASPGVARVTLFNPPPGGGTSEALFFVIRERGTHELRFEQHFIEVGSDGAHAFFFDGPWTPDTYLTVEGQPRLPEYVGGNRYTLRLTPEDVATPRAMEFRVVTPGEPPSAPAFLHVTRPLPPTLTGLSPGVVSTGEWLPGEPRALAVSGSNLGSREPAPIDPTHHGTIDWNGMPHPLEWLNGYRVWLPGEDVARPGPLLMTASRTAHGGGTSQPAILNVVAERPVPLLTFVRPAVVPARSGATRLRLTVAGLHPSSVVYWEDQPLPTREWWIPWSNGTRLMRKGRDRTFEREGLEAVVPASALTVPGVYRVTVVTPGPGGGTSLPLSVWVE